MLRKFLITILFVFYNSFVFASDEKPGRFFKDKINITNDDALIIQSNVAKLREKRGEEVIGYKIG